MKTHLSIKMHFLKQYLSERVASPFGFDPRPQMSYFVTFMANPLPPKRVTYFLNGPLDNCSKIKNLIKWFNFLININCETIKKCLYIITPMFTFIIACKIQILIIHYPLCVTSYRNETILPFIGNNQLYRFCKTASREGAHFMLFVCIRPI